MLSVTLPLSTPPDFCQNFLENFENFGKFSNMIPKRHESQGIHIVPTMIYKKKSKILEKSYGTYDFLKEISKY